MAMRLKWQTIATPLQRGGADFTDRFMAWWEGESVDARKRRAGNAPVVEIKDVLDEPTSEPPAEGRTWSSERVRITQTLWGAGFNVPAGPDYLRDLFMGMTPSPADSLLNIGAGLGGVEIAASKRFGAYVASFNPDPQLCSVSNAIVERQRVDDKVTIRPYEAPSACIRPGYYMGVTLIEHLFREADKGDFLMQMANGMKPDSLLAGTDLLIGDDADGSAVERWKAAEIGDVFPYGAAALKTDLAAAGFRIRSFDLDTGHYVARVVKALSHMVAEMHRMKEVSGEFDENLARALKEETELWGSRIDAMRAKALHHVKFVAIKQG